MGSIVLTLLVFGGAQTHALHSPCVPLDDSELSTRAMQIGSTEILADKLDGLVSVGEYWKSVCFADRQRASKRSVLILSNLLNEPAARLIVPSMLVDVGPNLKFGLNGINKAIADEKKWRKNHLRGVFVYSKGPPFLEALFCVKKKAKTGLKDPLCNVFNEFRQHELR